MIGTQPFILKSHLPMQSRADSGTPKIKVDPTKVFELMEHPVLMICFSLPQCRGRDDADALHSVFEHANRGPPRQQKQDRLRLHLERRQRSSRSEFERHPEVDQGPLTRGDESSAEVLRREGGRAGRCTVHS